MKLRHIFVGLFFLALPIGLFAQVQSGDVKSSIADHLGVFAPTTSAQLAGVITDETGTGALVYGTAPTITLGNATGLPLSTGVTGVLPATNGGAAWHIRTPLGTGITTDIYFPLGLSIAGNATEANVDVSVAPSDMICKNFYVVISAAPATTATWTVTVRSGAVGSLSNTAITCTITSAATTCNDTAHAVSFTAGTVQTILMDASATVPANSGVGSFSLECYKL